MGARSIFSRLARRFISIEIFQKVLLDTEFTSTFDRMPLGLHELTEPTEIDPLEARAFDKSSLALALRGYPLSRADSRRYYARRSSREKMCKES